MLSKVTSFKVGMQKRGMARILQPGIVSLGTEGGAFTLTKSKDVGNQTEDAEVKAAVLDILTTAEDQRDGNGACITHGQEDDTNTGKGVVGSLGAEVDQTEADLDDHAKDEGIEGDVQLLMDSLPPARAGNTTITGKGPSAARGSGDTADTTNETEHEKRDHQTKSPDAAAKGMLENDGGRLGFVQDIGDRRHDEAEGNQEEQTGDEVDDDGANHGLGNHNGGFAHLLTETDDHSSG